MYSSHSLPINLLVDYNFDNIDHFSTNTTLIRNKITHAYINTATDENDLPNSYTFLPYCTYNNYLFATLLHFSRNYVQYSTAQYSS